MDPLKQNIISALSFPAKEKRGLAVVAVIMMAIWLTPGIIRYFSAASIRKQAMVRYLEFREDIALQADKNHEGQVRQAGKAHNFDPNKASAEELEGLGFSKRISRRIVKYREMGGKFRRREDMLKIYGMDQSLYSEIESHITIAGSETQPFEKMPPEVAPTKGRSPIDLNLADSTELLALPGIGPVFAGRIISYRRSLGGFTAREQLREVYGISDSLYRKIEDGLFIGRPDSVRKLNINEADQQTLMKHPYFRKKAKVLVAYRELHGPFRDAGDLKGIQVLNDSLLGKMMPYISFQEVR